jgi:hypothetical protein
MATGFIFLVALIAVVAVIVWSVQHDDRNSVPRSGLFGLRPRGSSLLRADSNAGALRTTIGQTAKIGHSDELGRDRS